MCFKPTIIHSYQFYLFQVEIYTFIVCLASLNVTMYTPYVLTGLYLYVQCILVRVFVYKIRLVWHRTRVM